MPIKGACCAGASEKREIEIGVFEARRDALGRTLDAKQTEDLLDSLASRGWLRKKTTPTKGRPLNRWEVNPILLEDSVAQSALEMLASTQDPREHFGAIARRSSPEELRARGEAW